MWQIDWWWRNHTWCLCQPSYENLVWFLICICCFSVQHHIFVTQQYTLHSDKTMWWSLMHFKLQTVLYSHQPNKSSAGVYSGEFLYLNNWRHVICKAQVWWENIIQYVIIYSYIPVNEEFCMLGSIVQNESHTMSEPQCAIWYNVMVWLYKKNCEKLES